MPVGGSGERDTLKRIIARSVSKMQTAPHLIWNHAIMTATAIAVIAMMIAITAMLFANREIRRASRELDKLSSARASARSDSLEDNHSFTISLAGDLYLPFKNAAFTLASPCCSKSLIRSADVLIVCSFLELRYDNAMRTKTDSPRDVKGDFDVFKDFARQVLSVPHFEIKAELDREKAEKRTPKSASRVSGESTKPA
jgi:hypothetical protein